MKKRTKLILLLNLFVLVSCSNIFIKKDDSSKIDNIVKLKTNIKGVVTNSSTKETLKDATLFIGNNSTQTDENGVYSFSNLDRDKIKIIVSKNGFETHTEEKDLKTKDEVLNFSLKPVVILPTTTPIPYITPTPSTTPTPNSSSSPLPDNSNKTTFGGYFLEETSKKPLPYTGLKINTVLVFTDDKGHFFFPELPSGQQTVIEYLNGLDKEPVKQETQLSIGKNEFNLYYKASQINPNAPVTPTPTPAANNYDPKLQQVNFIRPSLKVSSALKPNTLDLKFTFNSNIKSTTAIFWDYGLIKLDVSIYENTSSNQATDVKKGSLILNKNVSLNSWKDYTSVDFTDIKKYGKYVIVSYTATLPDGRILTNEVNTLIS